MNTFTTLLMAVSLLLSGLLPSVAGHAQQPAAQGGITDFGPVSDHAGWLLADGRLYWTDTAGAEWRDITFDGLPGAQASDAAFNEGGDGWLLSTAPDAEGAARYVLARTQDGGQTWQHTPLALFARGEAGNYPAAVYLARLDGPDAATGWLVVKHVTSSNFSTGDLFRTTDGGQTWERLNVPLGEPVRFESAQIGYVMGGPAGDAAFRTADGGRTWQSVAHASAANLLANPATDVTRIEQGEAGTAWVSYARGACDRTTGRCTLTGGLRRTTDGGQTWAELPLPQRVSPRRSYTLQPAVVEAAAATPAAIPAPRTQILIGYGFDKCEVGRPEELQDWIVSSPYQAVNLYVGGAGRYCSNRALSAPLLRQLAGQGWSFIPTWVGPQAPCYAYEKLRMNPDPAMAYWQGRAEAEDANNVLASLGLAAADGRGSIVYYDMEYYDTTNVMCHAAVKSFIAGWTEQLHFRGHLAGVYGTGPTLSGFANQPEPPDAVWAAHWNRSYFDPAVTVRDVYRLSNDLWVNHQRVRQYTGGHNETWGTTTLNIDADVLSGIVAFVPPSLPLHPRVWLPGVMR